MPCVICGRGQAETGYACRPCFDRLDTALRDLEADAIQLSAVPSMAQRSGTRGGTLASHRSPARLDVLVLTDSRTAADDDGTLGILGVLASWARAVREDRQLAWPERVTLLTERRLLTVHLTWCAAQPWVDDFAQEIHALRRQVQRAAGTLDDPPKGSCYLEAPDGGTCGGPIWIDEAAGHAACGRCRATWDGRQLDLLMRAFERDKAEAQRPRTDDGRPMLTVEEIANKLRISKNAVALRLSRARIRAVRGHYDADRLTEKVTA